METYWLELTTPIWFDSDICTITPIINHHCWAGLDWHQVGSTETEHVRLQARRLINGRPDCSTFLISDQIHQRSKKFSGTFCARTCCKLQILFWSYSSKVLNPAKHFSFLLLVEVKLWHLNGLPRHIPNTGALFLRISVFDIPVFKFWVNSFLLNITLPSQLEPTCRMQCPTGFKMRRDSRDSCWQFYYMMHVFHISLDYKTNYKPHWFWATFILL